MFYVVEYRNCDCGCIGCPGEKEHYHFEHEHIEECRVFMLKFSDSIKAYTEVLQFNDTKDKIEIHVTLASGLIAKRKFRIQSVIKNFNALI